MLTVVDLPAAFAQIAEPGFVNQLGRRDRGGVALALQFAHGYLVELRENVAQDCFRDLPFSAGKAPQLLSEGGPVGHFVAPIVTNPTLTNVNEVKPSIG